MSENLQTFERAANWSVMREFKPVLRDFSTITGLDMSDLSNHEKLESLFADYFGSLASEAQRFDRPECLVYYRLSQLASPSIFKNPLGAEMESGLKLLKSPATDIKDPLYVVARETQNFDPGRVRLQSAYAFFPSGAITPNLHPTILEFDIEGGNTDRVARVPLVLTGDPRNDDFLGANLPVIERVVECLQKMSGVATVELKHLPHLKSKMKDLVTLTHERNILDWPLEFTGIPLKTPIVGAFLGDSRLDQDDTQLQSISINVGETTKNWVLMTKNWVLMPNLDLWKYWSFNNTVYQIRNVATENMLTLTKNLSLDILNLKGVETERSMRTATLAVHLPILVAGAFANTIPVGITSGLNYHQIEQAQIERNKREEESRFWGSYVE